MQLPRAAVLAAAAASYRLSLSSRRPVRAQRFLSELSSAPLRPPRGTTVRHVTVGGRPAERVSASGPPRAGAGPTGAGSGRPAAVLYLHGGGYVVGSPRMYRATAGYLARASGAVVVTLDYRLAPEHPYPAALDDAVAAFRDLAGEFEPARIAIAGDSAGGGLAVAAARLLTDAGTRPGALALLSPWTDPTDEDMPARDLVLDRGWSRQCADLYRGTASPHDPGYAPMYADLAGLPPTLIQAATAERLNAQIRRFAARAEVAGVDVRLVELPTLWHSAQVLAGLLGAATDAVHDVGEFVRRHLDAPSGE